MPWCLGASRKHAIEIGGWDEHYLKGTCFEDNDFVGRLVMKAGRFLGDWSACAYHQSHNQPAYDMSDPATKEAWKLNQTRTMAKWSGIPFDSQRTPFDIIRRPHESGEVVHEIKWVGTLQEDTIRDTAGIVADARVTA
jgi:hypothetical protein